MSTIIAEWPITVLNVGSIKLKLSLVLTSSLPPRELATQSYLKRAKEALENSLAKEFGTKVLEAH